MDTKTEKINGMKIDIKYVAVILVAIGSVLLFQLMGIFEERIYEVIPINAFLGYHTLLEFASVVISFTIFLVTYYTYEKNNRLRLLVFSSTFFMVGCIDLFHTLGYKGMPVFFTESSVAKATTFWIVSRVIMAVGLLLSGYVRYDRKTTLNRTLFLWISMILTIGIFYIVTYNSHLFPALYVEGKGLTPLKINLEYFTMILFGITMIFYFRDYEITKDRIFMIFSIGLVMAIFSSAAFTIYKSVYDTYNLLGHIYKILSLGLMLRAIFIYNLDKPYIELNNAKKKINLYAKNLEKIVERRTAEIQKVNEKMIEDLEYAKRIQQSLLPPKFLKIHGVKFISAYIPCEKLSGDFYDIHMIDEENIGMYIADVSGHGVSAAMMTVFTDRVLKPVDKMWKKKAPALPDKELMKLYEEFNKSSFPNEMHIVIFKAIYNKVTGILTYCSGGMNTQPILIKQDGGIHFLDESMGFPICKFGDFYTPEYINGEVALEKGDKVIFFTDGLVEHYRETSLLNKAGLIQILRDHKDKTLQELHHAIQDKIRDINQDFSLEDDITYFIVEV
ncbi:MAG: MASE3 domain-containing protein [Bacillota bacterium]